MKAKMNKKIKNRWRQGKEKKEKRGKKREEETKKWFCAEVKQRRVDGNKEELNKGNKTRNEGKEIKKYK